MNDQKEIEKLLKRTNEYRYLQIKENKKSYYAVDEWLDQYDYNLQLSNAIMNGINVPVDQVYNDWSFILIQCFLLFYLLP